jgi:hypothetical protein
MQNFFLMKSYYLFFLKKFFKKKFNLNSIFFFFKKNLKNREFYSKCLNMQGDLIPKIFNYYFVDNKKFYIEMEFIGKKKKI